MKLSKTDMNTLSTVLGDPGLVADQLKSMGLTICRDGMSMSEIAKGKSN